MIAVLGGMTCQITFNHLSYVRVLMDNADPAVITTISAKKEELC